MNDFTSWEWWCSRKGSQKWLTVPGLVVRVLVPPYRRSQARINVEGCVRKGIRHKFFAKSKP